MKKFIKKHKKELLIGFIFFVLGIMTPTQYLQDKIVDFVLGEKIDYIYIDITLEANSSNWSFLQDKEFIDKRAEWYNRSIEGAKRHYGADYHLEQPLSFFNGFALQELERTRNFKQKELPEIFSRWIMSLTLVDEQSENEVILEYHDSQNSLIGKECGSYSSYEDIGFGCKVTYKILVSDYSYPASKKALSYLRYGELKNKTSSIMVFTNPLIRIKDIKVRFGAQGQGYDLDNTTIHSVDNHYEKYWLNTTRLP